MIVDDRDEELKIRERLAGIVAEMVSGVDKAHPVLRDIRIGNSAYLFIQGLIDMEEGRL